jgi:hypothetical protein
LNTDEEGDYTKRRKLNVEKGLDCKANTLRNLKIIGSPNISDNINTLVKIN